MNQENYTEIAKIIYIRKKNFAVCDKPNFNGDSYKMACDEIAKDLADYFGEEDKKLKRISKHNKLSSDKEFKDYWKKEHFNRKQFLKECGVE